MPDSDDESGGPSNADFSSPREQDRFLPIANVSRIMKKALPANAKISKDAKELGDDATPGERLGSPSPTRSTSAQIAVPTDSVH